MPRLLLILALLAPAFASAAPLDGAGLLKRMDEAMARSEDMTFRYDVLNVEPGSEPKGMQLRVWVKDTLRLTEFEAPGDMKGTKALVLGQSQMYIYLPAYKKVRRVSSSLSEGGFMGTTFSNEDISTTEYSPYYDAALTSEDDQAWTLTLTPKADAQVGYSKLEIKMAKKFEVPVEIKYFNKKGQHTKTESRTGTSCEGNVCTAEVMTMVDHTRGDASTSLTRTEWEVNTGLDDDLFTTRTLQQ
jgi:outer membrane lipoprotein-sorting protein